MGVKQMDNKNTHFATIENFIDNLSDLLNCKMENIVNPDENNDLITLNDTQQLIILITLLKTYNQINNTFYGNNLKIMYTVGNITDFDIVNMLTGEIINIWF